MKKAYRYILPISILLTVSLFVHDWLYDPVQGTYSAGQIVQDILSAGALYCGIFFLVLLAGYEGVTAVLKLKKKTILEAKK